MHPSKLMLECDEGEFKLKKDEKRCQKFFRMKSSASFRSQNGDLNLDIGWVDQEGEEPSMVDRNSGVMHGYYRILVNGTLFDDLEPMPELATPPTKIRRRNVKTYKTRQVL